MTNGYTDRWRLFLEATENDVKNLKFGDLTKPKLIKKLSETPKLLTISLSDIPSRNHPENDSETAKKELEYIAQQVNLRNKDGFDDEVLKKTDEKPLTLFLNYLKSKELRHDEKFLKDIYKDVSRLVLKLKMHYNRPRPQQLGPLLGIKFEEVPTSTDATPSFPSGHTTQAWTVAHYLSDKYPDHKAEFYNIARLIERSRICRGAHYPSDNVYAKFIAKHYLSPNVKEVAKQYEELET